MGLPVGTRTPDLYRVNSEVNNLKPFACLAFPCNTYLKTLQKQPIFGDELVTSFSFHSLENVLSRVDEYNRDLSTVNSRATGQEQRIRLDSTLYE